jgi:hypothetical protein
MMSSAERAALREAHTIGGHGGCMAIGQCKVIRLLDDLDAKDAELATLRDTCLAIGKQMEAERDAARAALRDLSALIAARRINEKHADAIAAARKP